MQPMKSGKFRNFFWSLATMQTGHRIAASVEPAIFQTSLWTWAEWSEWYKDILKIYKNIKILYTLLSYCINTQASRSVIFNETMSSHRRDDGIMAPVHFDPKDSTFACIARGSIPFYPLPFLPRIMGMWEDVTFHPAPGGPSLNTMQALQHRKRPPKWSVLGSKWKKQWP